MSVFVDYENIRKSIEKKIEGNYETGKVVTKSIENVLEESQKIVLGKIYLPLGMDKKTGRGGKTREKLWEFFKRGLSPVHTPKDYGKNKSYCDPMMVCDIMESLYEKTDIETYILLTGDKDFLPVIREIASKGKEVILINVSQTEAKNLNEECERFGFDNHDIISLYETNPESR